MVLQWRSFENDMGEYISDPNEIIATFAYGSISTGVFQAKSPELQCRETMAAFLVSSLSGLTLKEEETIYDSQPKADTSLSRFHLSVRSYDILPFIDSMPSLKRLEEVMGLTPTKFYRCQEINQDNVSEEVTVLKASKNWLTSTATLSLYLLLLRCMVGGFNIDHLGYSNKTCSDVYDEEDTDISNLIEIAQGLDIVLIMRSLDKIFGCQQITGRYDSCLLNQEYLNIYDPMGEMKGNAVDIYDIIGNGISNFLDNFQNTNGENRSKHLGIVWVEAYRELIKKPSVQDKQTNKEDD